MLLKSKDIQLPKFKDIASKGINNRLLKKKVNGKRKKRQVKTYEADFSGFMRSSRLVQVNALANQHYQVSTRLSQNATMEAAEED